MFNAIFSLKLPVKEDTLISSQARKEYKRNLFHMSDHRGRDYTYNKHEIKPLSRDSLLAKHT